MTPLPGLSYFVYMINRWFAPPANVPNSCAPRRAAELLIHVQRHHGMNFPNCVFLFRSSV